MVPEPVRHPNHNSVIRGRSSGYSGLVAYAVQTPVYEGPFDLLLHLILREQVELYEISLSTIVDAYLTELARMEHLDLEIATEFLLIASTLVELKTKRLLPGDEDVDLDDDLSLWEERDLLLSRLLECKTFKDAASVLELHHQRAGRVVGRCIGPDERYIDLAPDLLEGVTADRLRDAFLAAVAPKPTATVDLFHIAPIRASVVDAVADLCVELPRRRSVTFRDLTSALAERLDVVVHFLAILELFKQGLVDLRQPSTFGDIEVVWQGGDHADADALASVDVYDG